jgi:hypothetical protein
MLVRRRDGGPAGRVVAVAAAARTAGTAVVEGGWAGFVENTAPTGARYTLAVLGEFEIPAIAEAAVGDTVFINTATFVLTRSAPIHTATYPAGTIPFGKVTAIPGSGQFPAGASPGAASSPPAGKIWISLFPQLP